MSFISHFAYFTAADIILLLWQTISSTKAKECL